MKFEKFLDNLTHWLKDYDIDAKIKLNKKKQEANICLKMDGEIFHVGNFGLKEKHTVICINGIVFEAFARHVASWVIGYQ